MVLAMGMCMQAIFSQSLPRAWKRTKEVPGAAYVLVKRDSVLEAGGFGMVGLGEAKAIDEKTLFRAGSLGKIVVAMGIYCLVDQGKLNLSDQLSSILPDIVLDNPWAETDPVVIQHLLEHSSGIGDMHFNEYYATEPQPLIKSFAVNPTSKSVRWRPGTTSAYSNVGYALLAMVGERVTGQNWKSWLKDVIFEPLEMTHSGFGLFPGGNNRSMGHMDGQSLESNPFYLYQPALSFYSTAIDLGKLLSCMVVEDSDFLSPQSWYSLSANESSLAGKAGMREGYGGGLQTHHFEGWAFHYHTGKVDGFSSVLEYSTELQTGFAVLYNAHPKEPLMSSPLVAACRLRGMDRRRNLDERPLRLVPLQDSLPNEAAGYYSFANPRNDLLAPLDEVMLGVQVKKDAAWWRIGRDAYFEMRGGRLGKRKTIHCGAVLGRDLEGNWFLQKGKYFYRKSSRSLPWFFKGFFWLYLSTSVLLLLFETWIRLNRGNRFHSWFYLAPILAAGGYVLVKTADFATLGSFNPTTLVVFLASCLIPLLAFYLPIRWLKKRSGQPLLLQGLAGLVALCNAGLVMFMLWAGWIGLALWNW